MFPYLLVLFFVIVWVYFEKLTLNRQAFWIPLFVLAMFAGMRSSNVGTDTENYTYNYILRIDQDYYDFNDNIEKGYQLLDYLIIGFSYNYFWLLFLTAFFIVFSYLRIIKNYSENYLLSIVLFITLGLYTFLFNGLRQALAMAIMAYSVKYLLEEKVLAYLLVCIIASTFHISALIMIPFYFLVNLNLSVVYKIILVGLGGGVLSSIAIQYMAQNNQRYEAYTESGEFAGLYTLGFYIINAIILFLINCKLKISDNSFKKFSSLYYMGVALLIPIAFLGVNPSGPQRIIGYFSWTLIFLFPIILNKLNNVVLKFIFFIVTIFYYYLTVNAFGGLIPYSINPILNFL